MLEFLFWFGVVVNAGAFIEMCFKLYKNKSMKAAIKSPYGRFFLYTFLITCLIYISLIDWSKFHHDDAKLKPIVKIIHDTIKTTEQKTDTSVINDRPHKYRPMPIPTDHHSLPQPVDASKKQLTEDNSLKVDRSPGSINVAGKNNNVYVNAEKKLTEAGLLMVKKSVDSVRSIYKIPKVISIGSYGNCNAPLMLGQLEDYFNQLGYHVDGGGSAMSNIFRYGFIYGRMADSTRVTLDLGFFK